MPIPNVIHTSNAIVAGAPDELVVLKATGARTRMAKTLSVTTSGQYAVGPHDGRKVYHVSFVKIISTGNLFSAARELAALQRDEFVIRGALQPGLPSTFRRLLNSKPGRPAPTIADVPRSYVIFDLDGVANVLPWYTPSTADVETVEAAVAELVIEILPPEFAGVDCWYSFTASHGIKPGMRLRLLFRLDCPVESADLKVWLGHLRHVGVDTSVFSPAQQILIAPPIISRGVSDPLVIRSGIYLGARREVAVPSMTSIRVFASLTLSPTSRITTPKTRPSASSNVPSSSKSYGGTGYLTALDRIGDGPGQSGIHQAILSAVGAGVRQFGPSVSVAKIVGDIVAQLSTAVIDSTKHPATYISDQLDALPNMIQDVCGMEEARLRSEAKAHETRFRSPVPADRTPVTATADEAATELRRAIQKFLETVPALKKKRDFLWHRSHGNDFGQSYITMRLLRSWQIRVAAIVDPGVGKTQAVIEGVVALAIAQPDFRMAYVVPFHRLADDVARRFDAAAGFQITAVWRGLGQADPDDPAEKMCRRLPETELLFKAGGSLGYLCGSAAKGYCRFHPEVGGACAYQRQKRQSAIWIVAAALLTDAVPDWLQRDPVEFDYGTRLHSFTPPPFDLVVLDEAPFMTWVNDEGLFVEEDWLNPGHYQSALEARNPEYFLIVEKALLALQAVVKILSTGQDALSAFYAAEAKDNITDATPEFSRAADLLWNAFEHPDVNPSDTVQTLETQLASQFPLVQQVRAVQIILCVHADLLDSKGSISSFQYVTAANGRASIRVRWREDIDRSWLDCPTLYLDATASVQLAERWLGRIETLVEAKAAAPHMRLIQVDDRSFGYGSLIADPNAKGKSAALTQQRLLADLMLVSRHATGGEGLLVAPKALVKEMTNADVMPNGWKVATFGSLRGVDLYKDVSVAIVVSRPLPPPSAVERMAELIFGQPVQRITEGWYPTIEGVRLMADGTGRQAEFECHPDPLAEIVRRTLCDNEALQGIGRVRAGRRGPDNPVRVIVLNRVDLGDIPVSELTTWAELTAQCGPMMQMAARGVIPRLWSDVAHMVGRWNDTTDPAASARGWFRDNPHEKALREGLLKSGLLKHSISGIEMAFRRESLGMVGRNHRYVWLAPNVTIEIARQMLP